MIDLSEVSNKREYSACDQVQSMTGEMFSHHTRVANQQNNPCLVRKHLPWYLYIPQLKIRESISCGHNTSKITIRQGACPRGWRLPLMKEGMQNLVSYIFIFCFYSWDRRRYYYRVSFGHISCNSGWSRLFDILRFRERQLQGPSVSPSVGSIFFFYCPTDLLVRYRKIHGKRPNVWPRKPILV